jgi:hypothetical protein
MVQTKAIVRLSVSVERQRECGGISLAFGSSINYPTTARTQTITQKSAESMAPIARAGFG